ncbi:MAG: metallophosphoesterase [Candidatus Eremiobacteraeota bacterium]|nr:metallophosphoesterase [Candidatus Eremiobacteraeota bacterium]
MLVAALLSAWLQYGADAKPHARAVVTDAACPRMLVDGRAVAMERRAGKAPQFDDTVCDAAIAADAKSVRVGDRALPPPAHDPRTVVVLGDTGCRINLLTAQACNDPAGWPFPAIARAIAAVHPDLVIHVGDYLYREHGCPPVLANCANSPHGDDAPAWYADFLTPAAPLFAHVPLLLLRGNHEVCDRNGTGWFRYLDPHPTTACTEATDPYAIDVGDLRIVAFDSATAEDQKVDPSRAPIYRKQFAAARAMVKGPTWFVTHRPPYTNDDERSAMDDNLAPFEAVLSGHFHFFAALNVATLPPLVINGEGGTKLDPNLAGFLGLAVGDLHVVGTVFGISHNGFGVYTREHGGWSISLRDPDGTERARCRLADRGVHCTPPP